MTWPRFMLGLLGVLTLGQLAAIIKVDTGHPLAIVAHALPTVGLWAGYAYRYAPDFRVRVVRLLAYFGDRRTSIRVTARFGFTGEVRADDVVETIRERYAAIGSQVAVRAFPAAGRTIVEMPGWVARIQFSSSSPQEEVLGDPDTEQVGELLFTMPDTQNAIGSARTLLGTDILPLFEALTKELPLTLEATEVTIRFLKQPNPYLAAYLQNVDLDKIAALTCVLQEPHKDSEATISRDKVALRATTLADMRNLVEKHLALQWSIR